MAKLISKPKPFVLPETIKIVGTTIASETSGREIVIEFFSDTSPRVAHLSLAALGSGDHKPFANELAEAGHFRLARRDLVGMVADQVLRRAAASKTIVLTSSGVSKIHLNNQIFTAYAWAGEAYWFGPSPPVEVVVSARTCTERSSGTAAEWTSGHEGVLPGNPYLIVTYVHSLAAVLCRPFGVRLPIILLVGPSTTGKTTDQKGAQSMVGHPNQVKTMTGTKVGIIGHLTAKPDQPVFFQDVRQVDKAIDLPDIIFDVADGSGRMKFGETPKDIAAVMILSNERNLMDMPQVRKGGLDEGIYARLLEINFTGPSGAFHNLHGEQSAADFAKRIEKVCSECYGTVWPVWLDALSNNWSEVTALYKEWMSKVKAKIAKHAGTAEINSISNRLLDALTFSAWVGCIASHFGILPVKKDEITDAFGLVFAEQIMRQLKGATPLGDKLVKDVRGFLDENHARFPDLADFDTGTNRNAVYGYRKTTKQGGDVFLFFPSVFDRHFVTEYGSVAYSILKQAGFLLAGKGDSNQCQVRIPETEDRKRFVAIKASIRFDKSE